MKLIFQVVVHNDRAQIIQINDRVVFHKDYPVQLPNLDQYREGTRLRVEVDTETGTINVRKV